MTAQGLPPLLSPACLQQAAMHTGLPDRTLLNPRGNPAAVRSFRAPSHQLLGPRADTLRVSQQSVVTPPASSTNGVPTGFQAMPHQAAAEAAARDPQPPPG